MPHALVEEAPSRAAMSSPRTPAKTPSKADKGSNTKRRRGDDDTAQRERDHKRPKTIEETIPDTPLPSVTPVERPDVERTPADTPSKKKNKTPGSRKRQSDGLPLAAETPTAKGEMPGAIEDTSSRKKHIERKHRSANAQTVDGPDDGIELSDSKQRKGGNHESEEGGKAGSSLGTPKKTTKRPKGDDSVADAERREGAGETTIDSKMKIETPKKARKRSKGDNGAADEERREGAGESTIDSKMKTETPKKARKRTHAETGTTPRNTKDDREPEAEDEPGLQESTKKKKKKNEQVERPAAETARGEGDVGMESPIRLQQATALRPAGAPEKPDFPFFKQTVSLYLPLYPASFDKPVTSAIEQYFNPSLNHYSSKFGGVLLGFSDVRVGRPKRPDPKNPQTDKTPTVLESVDAYAAGFSFITANLDLFVPSRGAWMMGRVILQSEGHLGVLCWDRFNASIEARRLPRGWHFVDLALREERAKKSRAMGMAPPQQPPQEEDGAEADGSPVTGQMHSTGYWADELGRRVKGDVLFRIKSYEVGKAGEQSWLSIEGTMLDDEEREVLAKEMEDERRRKLRLPGSLQQEERRVPEFSLTRFEEEGGEEEAIGQEQELYRESGPGTPGSRPGSPR